METRRTRVARWAVLFLVVAGVCWTRPVAPAAQTWVTAESTSSAFREWIVPTAGSYPAQIAVDGQGRVWITEQDANQLAVFDPRTEGWQEYALPTPDGQPWGMALDGLGDVWVAERAGNKIARFDPATEDWTEYLLPTGSQPYDLDVRWDGTVWFTERAGGKIGKLVPATGEIAEVAVLPVGALPGSISAGSFVWFVETLSPTLGALGLAVPATFKVFPLYLPAGLALPQDLATNRAGDPWFTDAEANKIALYRASTLGDFLQIEVPTPNSEPFGIAVASDGPVWFTERTGNKLGRFVGAEPPAEYPLPTPDSLPTGIAVDGAGCAWYTAPGANRIGRLCLLRTFLPTISRCGGCALQAPRQESGP